MTPPDATIIRVEIVDGRLAVQVLFADGVAACWWPLSAIREYAGMVDEPPSIASAMTMQ